MVTIVWDVDDVLNDLMSQWFMRGVAARTSQLRDRIRGADRESSA